MVQLAKNKENQDKSNIYLQFLVLVPEHNILRKCILILILELRNNFDISLDQNDQVEKTISGNILPHMYLHTSTDLST